jgi:AcrR family transcriptional regulator
MAKVSRPLIYYHVGKTKKEILDACIQIIGDEFYGLTEERTKMLQNGNMLESVLRTHQMFMKAPALAILYLRSRTEASFLQKSFMQLEQRYQAKLRKALPKLNKVEVAALHAMLHGLVTAPFADRETLTVAVRMLGVALNAPRGNMR